MALNLSTFNAAQQFAAQNEMMAKNISNMQTAAAAAQLLSRKKKDEEESAQKAYEGLNAFLSQQDSQSQTHPTVASVQGQNLKTQQPSPVANIEEGGLQTPEGPAKPATQESELERLIMNKATEPTNTINSPQYSGGYETLPLLSKMFAKTPATVEPTMQTPVAGSQEKIQPQINAASEETSATAEPAKSVPQMAKRQMVPGGQSSEAYGKIAAELMKPSTAKPAWRMGFDENDKQFVVDANDPLMAKHYTGGTRHAPTQLTWTADAQGNINPEIVSRSQPGVVPAPEGRKFVTQGQLTAQERQKGQFKELYDPLLGYSRPFSASELRQRLEQYGPDQMPPSRAEADKIMQIGGRQVAVFNAAENARAAADAAIAKNGQLNFADTQIAPGMSLTQMAAMIARLNHSNDVIDNNMLNTYMHGLVNSAMDAETRNYANHLLTLYEAGVGANAMIGGSNQSSDMRYRALLSALPGPVDRNQEDIHGKLNRFETDLALSLSTLPRIRLPHGYTVQEINRELQAVQTGQVPYQDSIIAKLAGTAGTTGSTPPRQTATPAPAPKPAAPGATKERWTIDESGNPVRVQ